MQILSLPHRGGNIVSSRPLLKCTSEYEEEKNSIEKIATNNESSAKDIKRNKNYKIMW